jgi:hypothetical protein
MGLSALPADFCLHAKLPFVYKDRECECAGNPFQCEAVPPEAGTAGCTCGGFYCKGDGSHAFEKAALERRAAFKQMEAKFLLENPDDHMHNVNRQRRAWVAHVGLGSFLESSSEQQL